MATDLAPGASETTFNEKTWFLPTVIVFLKDPLSLKVITSTIDELSPALITTNLALLETSAVAPTKNCCSWGAKQLTPPAQIPDFEIQAIELVPSPSTITELLFVNNLLVFAGTNL